MADQCRDAGKSLARADVGGEYDGLIARGFDHETEVGHCNDVEPPEVVRRHRYQVHAGLKSAERDLLAEDSFEIARRDAQLPGLDLLQLLDGCQLDVFELAPVGRQPVRQPA